MKWLQAPIKSTGLIEDIIAKHSEVCRIRVTTSQTSSWLHHILAFSFLLLRGVTRGGVTKKTASKMLDSSVRVRLFSQPRKMLIYEQRKLLILKYNLIIAANVGGRPPTCSTIETASSTHVCLCVY